MFRMLFRALGHASRHGHKVHKAVHHGSRIATNVHKAAWTSGGHKALRRTIPQQSVGQFLKQTTKPR
jgi:hypothetical protein